MTTPRAVGASLRVLAAPLRGLVALAILLHDVIVWAGGPLWRRLEALRLLRRLAEAVAKLPRGGVLLALAAPVALAEPMKLGGLYLLARGQATLGVVLQIAGHAVSILLVERIVDAGLPQLLTYRWFAWSWGWVTTIRAAMARWPLVVSTRETARRVAAQAREAARDLRRWIARFARR